MIRISGYQMFALMAMFQLGTTIIFGFASEAGRDAWISAIVSMLFGLMILFGYLLIYRLNGGLSLVDWFPSALGRWIGTPIAWLYPMIFIYDAGRVISDLRFLFPVTILHGTPDWVIGFTFMIAVGYALFGGFEVIARVASILFPVVLLFILLETLFLYASDCFDFHYLLPVFAGGWGKVWPTVWPLGMMQTFGESVAFALFWSHLNPQSRLSAVVGGSALLAGLLIAALDILCIAGLGVGVFEQSVYPSFALLKLASIADFLENLDALGIIYFVATAYVKISVQLLSAVYCIRKLLALRSDGPIIVGVSCAALFVSMMMATSFTEHMVVAERTLPRLFWVPLFLVMPGVVLAVAAMRRGLKGART